MDILRCFYYGGENFGDSVNKIFIDFLSEKKFSYEKVITSPHYMITGSVLHFSNSNSIIFGSGFISKESRLGSHTVKKVIAVRGPLTRDKLIKMKIECPEVYGDPLILFPLIYNPQIQKKPKLIGIIPHYVDSKARTLKTLSKNLENNGYAVQLIDILVGINYKPFIDKILECEIIISSSLHGIIMGIVYKKPTILVQFSNKVIGDLFKFNDFFGSLNTEYQVNNIYDISLLNNTIHVDYVRLKELGDGLIDNAPFIENLRKIDLKCKYNV